MAGPSSSSTRPPPSSATTRSLRSSVKRDLSTAQLPESSSGPSSNKRALLSSTLTHASLERQLASYKTTNLDLEARLREKDALIAELTRDRRFLADREASERSAREELEGEMREKEGRYLAQISDTRGKYDASQGEVMDLRDELARVKRQYERTIGDQKIELNTLKKASEVSKKEFLDWKEKAEKLKAVEDEKKAMDEYVKVVKEEYDKVLAEMEEAKDEAVERKEELEEELAGKNREIQALKDTIEEQAEQWKALEAHAESLEETLRAQPPPQPAESTSTSAMSLTETFTPGDTSASPAAKSRAARESISSRLRTPTPSSSPTRPRKQRQSLGMGTPLRKVHTENWDSFRESYHSTHSPLRLHKQEKEDDTKEREERVKKDRDMLGPHLASLTEHVRKLESENVRLRADLGVLKARDQSIQVLNEEKSSLQLRLARQEAEVNRLIREVETLRSTVSASSSPPRRRGRTSTAGPSSTSGAASPMVVDEADTPTVEETATLGTLRIEHAKLLEEYGILKAELAALRSSSPDASSLHSANTSALTLVDSSSSSVLGNSEQKDEALELRLKLKDRQLAETQREIGYLKAWVESYTLEMQLVVPNAGAGSSPDPTTGEASALAKMDRLRITQLEDLLSTSRSETEKLRTEIDRLLSSNNSPLSAAQSQITSLQSELAASNTRIEEFEAQVENLEQTLFDLRGEIAGGRHTPPNTRILALRQNPLQELVKVGREEFERLRVENEGLLKRLGELEAASASGSSGGIKIQPEEVDLESGVDKLPELIPKATLLKVMRQKEAADEERDQIGKRLLRLRQVFSVKSDEFKETIGSVLGVKVAFYPNGQVRITSVYDLNASFVFSPTKDNSTTRMQLVGHSPEAPQDFSNWQNFWIETEGCIPGFLATVTLESFDKWKRGGGGELPDLSS
ncbi:mitotic spindle checkpoint protein mad1 [Moniliophthora roreri]|uniref:Spindle assembly checkpoint component MAD1 n=1 Tax=Moniliophthora roreri TaxID=221103 RepID=A0A0W0G663_MONRR|nr:mitotic spindle checkpoint protein mad1 [Moniliophthora roreri]